METRKGRLIPNVKPTSFFYEEGNRSPFEGELNYDSENNIGFWSKNQNNVWENHAASAVIQDKIDSYGELGDNTFQNAQAYYESGVIHRFFYNQIGQKVWLDDSIDISKFAYYAILGIGLDKGKYRYVTGLVDSDGSDFEKALIPTSKHIGTLTRDINSNNWYTVEFYNEKKEKVHSVNYLAYQSFNMPIDLAFEPDNVTNTIINVSLTFNQVKNNKGLLYKGQSIEELKPILILTMADGHQVTITDMSKMNLSGLEKIDNSKEGEYSVRAEYNIFDNDSNSTVLFKTYKENVLYLHSQSEQVPVKVTVPKPELDSHDRVYKEVRVRGIGNSDYKSITDFTVETNSEGNDVITIPYNYFKIEKNLVTVLYTEVKDNVVVKSKSLHIQAEAKVLVEEKPAFTYKKFYVVGYVENREIFFKFFILTNEEYIAEITDDVSIVYPEDYGPGKVNRLVAEFYGETVAFFVYYKDINLTGAKKRILTSLNANELLTNPDNSLRPLLLCSTLQDESLRTGIGTFVSSQEASFADFASFITNNAIEYMRIRAIRPSVKVISDYSEINPISIVPNYKEFKRLYNRYPEKVSELAKDLIPQPNYIKSYRLIKYKNVTVSNKAVSEDELVSDKTLKEILQMKQAPVSEFGTFIGYSINNANLLTEEDENRIIKAGTSIHIFAFFAKAISEDDVIEGNFPGHLEVKYTLNRQSVRLNEDDPLLVEGYIKTLDGKYKCLGAVVCHASIR